MPGSRVLPSFPQAVTKLQSRPPLGCTFEERTPSRPWRVILMMFMPRAIHTACLAAMLVCISAGQTGNPLSFEVASVKLARPLVPGESRGTKRGIDRIELQYATLRNCIVYAYRVKDFQVSAPAWLDDLHYDIVAKGPAGTRPDHLQEMLQTLLAERFKLQIHRETKEVAGLALVVGKDGPKFEKAAQESEDPNGHPMPSLAPGSFRVSPGRGGV